MQSATVKITAKEGFHARPASDFVKMACDYHSEVFLSTGESYVNGKSIMSILTLGAAMDSDLILTVDGSDENEALEALSAFLINMK